MASAYPPPSRKSGPAVQGGRVCSLNYRPRRWFGYRLEQIVADFLRLDEPELLGIEPTVVDLLKGAVRADLDERVLVSAHNSPVRGSALVTVTLFYKVPTSSGYEVDQVLTTLGRGSLQTSYYRIATKEGALPVRGSLRIRSTVIGTTDGESTIVTTMTASARAVTKPRRREDPAQESQGA